MKTPEDIKKALECCSDADGFDGDCIKCPYKGEQWCGDKSKTDAEHIEELSTALTEVLKERDSLQNRIQELENRKITLRKILQLCPDGQEVCLIADEGCITSTPEIMIDFLIESVTESTVTNIEPEKGVLKVWI